MLLLIKIKDLPQEELLYGHLACSGCGGMLAIRLALKVLGKDTIVVIPACCAMAVTCFYPQIPFGVPYLVSSFPGTASAMSGVVAGLKRKGLESIKVVGFAGDGGTMDIGIQALSGTVERGEQLLYICYDNEAYMNTGAQRSSGTPLGAKTTTTPVGRLGMDEDHPKKDIFSILVAHGIPYAATASLGYPLDYLNKVKKAMMTKGPSFIHVLAPCPPGWGIPVHETISIAREIVSCGIFPLREFTDGQLKEPKRVKKRLSVEEYLKKQRRFKHLSEERIQQIKERVDSYWEDI